MAAPLPAPHLAPHRPPRRRRRPIVNGHVLVAPVLPIVIPLPLAHVHLVQPLQRLLYPRGACARGVEGGLVSAGAGRLITPGALTLSELQRLLRSHGPSAACWPAQRDHPPASRAHQHAEPGPTPPASPRVDRTAPSAHLAWPCLAPPLGTPRCRPPRGPAACGSSAPWPPAWSLACVGEGPWGARLEATVIPLPMLKDG